MPHGAISSGASTPGISFCLGLILSGICLFLPSTEPMVWHTICTQGPLMVE